MKNRNSNKRFILIGIVLILLAAGGAWLFSMQKDKTNADNNWADGVNYGPPTKQEQEAGDEQKQQIVEQEERREQSARQADRPNNKKKVTVIITNAGQYENIIEVRSFVPDHYEDGTCSIILTRSGQTVKKTMPAKKDISSTVCLDPQINRADFPTNGEWQVQVTYESKGATGESDPQNITIR